MTFVSLLAAYLTKCWPFSQPGSLMASSKRSASRTRLGMSSRSSHPWSRACNWMLHHLAEFFSTMISSSLNGTRACCLSFVLGSAARATAWSNWIYTMLCHLLSSCKQFLKRCLTTKPVHSKTSTCIVFELWEAAKTWLRCSNSSLLTRNNSQNSTWDNVEHIIPILWLIGSKWRSAEHSSRVEELLIARSSLWEMTFMANEQQKEKEGKELKKQIWS